LIQELNIDQKHNMTTGLTVREIEERRAILGENRLPSEKPVSAWTILLNQLKSPLVYIILAAVGISLMLGEFGDFAFILAVHISKRERQLTRKCLHSNPQAASCKPGTENHLTWHRQAIWRVLHFDHLTCLTGHPHTMGITD
jgi:hypothetical protein